MRTLTSILLFAIFPASSIQADSLGRLFFTPEQRAQLERNHAHSAAEGTPFSILTVNGIVQQHGGARTVWINGVAQIAGHDGDSTTEAVAVPGKTQPIKIKVGEKLLLDMPEPKSLPASGD